MKKLLIGITLLAVIFTSCDKLDPVVDNPALSEAEVIEGLKKALEIGVDSAVSELHLINGYYHGDVNFVKIPLPQEAEQVRQLINSNRNNFV